MPETSPLTGATESLNGEPKWDEVRGAPTLVHFWAVSSHICHENMLTIAEWRDAYAPAGLRVVAIHMPREEVDTAVARERDNITRVNDNRYVSAHFLFDREGVSRSRAAGGAAIDLLEGALARQFGET